MGIKDLYPTIRAATVDVGGVNPLKTYHLSELSGYRFAIDISVFLYKYIRSAGPERWMNTFMLLMCTLKKHGIKAVCIFDGPNPPIEKKDEQIRRRSENQKAINRLQEAVRVRDILQNEYLADDKIPKGQLREDCENILLRRRKKNGEIINPVNYLNPSDIIDALNELIEKLERQTLPITDDYRELAMSIVEMMGLHAIQAEGEAETLCAYLAVTGKCDAVLTEDTDVLAYGTPLMLAFKDFKLNEEKLIGIHIEDVLQEMNLEFEEFQDLCILLSCDYNSRVKGFPPDGTNRKKPVGIGVKGALAMINEYRRLEKVCEYVVDPEPLKYRRCRELFTIPKKVPEDMIPYNLEPDYDRLERFIDEFRLTIKVPYIRKMYKPPKVLFDSATDEDEDILERDLEEIDSESASTSSESSLGVDDDSSRDFEENISLGDDDDFTVAASSSSLSSKDSTETFEYDLDKCLYVVLTAMCQHDETDKTSVKDAHFKFITEELFDIHNDTGFDHLIEPFCEWLKANGQEGWYVDDVIEAKTILKSSEDSIMPYVVTK